MRSKLVLSLLVLFLALLACSMPVGPWLPVTPTALQPPTPTLPPPPDVTPVPTETPLSPPRLFQQVTLTAEPYSESGDAPVYTLETNKPVLEGSEDPRALAFNRLAAEILDGLVAEFKSGFEYLSETPISAGSFFQVTFLQLAPPGDILSIEFNVDAYADGAAHPYHLTRSLNFDLEAGQELALEDLFLPDSDFLTVIADYCKAELSTREIGFDLGFSPGADPLPENYQVWNLTFEGIVITFDEYQVAPYAAGRQQVLVPFDVLQEILAEDFARP